MRIAQIGVGVAGIAGGYLLASGTVQTAFRNDLTGDPSRVVERNGEWIIDQPRDPQGPGLTKALMGAGALGAGIGAALTMGGVPSKSLRSIAQHGGGAIAFGAGIGIVAGAIATFMQYRNADVRRA